MMEKLRWANDLHHVYLKRDESEDGDGIQEEKRKDSRDIIPSS